MNANGLFRGPDSEPITTLSRDEYAERLGHGKEDVDES
jgi:hypothetical protein